MKQFLLITLFASVAASAATTHKITVSGGEIAFTAVGKPSFLKIHGTGEGPTGQILVENSQLKEGSLKIDLGKLTTGIELRDDHMKNKYLEVAKEDFAITQLKITKLDLTGLALDGAFEKALPFEGTLRLHGVEKPLVGTLNLKRASATSPVEIETQFPIKVEDFGIPTPEYAKIRVTDTVDVRVKSSATVETLAASGVKTK